nr:protein pin-likes 7 [Quercus suber]
MALGGFFIWTYTYQLIRTSSKKFKALQATEKISKTPNNDLSADPTTQLLKGEDQERVAIIVSSIKSIEDSEDQVIVAQGSASGLEKDNL